MDVILINVWSANNAKKMIYVSVKISMINNKNTMRIL
jgi:hypothetical protein